MEDVDRAAAGAARCDALEKKGAGGLRLQVKYTVERHSLYSMQKESTALAVPILELKCVWQFPKKFPLALNYYSRFLL